MKRARDHSLFAFFFLFSLRFCSVLSPAWISFGRWVACLPCLLYQVTHPSPARRDRIIDRNKLHRRNDTQGREKETEPGVWRMKETDRRRVKHTFSLSFRSMFFSVLPNNNMSSSCIFPPTHFSGWYVSFARSILSLPFSRGWKVTQLLGERKKNPATFFSSIEQLQLFSKPEHLFLSKICSDSTLFPPVSSCLNQRRKAHMYIILFPNTPFHLSFLFLRDTHQQFAWKDALMSPDHTSGVRVYTVYLFFARGKMQAKKIQAKVWCQVLTPLSVGGTWITWTAGLR